MYLLGYIAVFIIVLVIGVAVLIYGFIKGRHELIKYTALTLVAIAMILPSHYYYCFERSILTKQIVNISPMQNVKLTRNINTIKESFMEYEVKLSDGILPETKSKDFSGRKEEIRKRYENGAVVRITLFYTEEDASRSFSLKSEDNRVDEIDTKGRENNGSYCISYVKANRTDPEGGSVLTGRYRSYVAFQKQNLLITVAEDGSENNRGDGKDEIIKEIATKLAEVEAKNTAVRQ